MDFMYVYEEDAYQGFFEGDNAFWRKYALFLYTGFYIFGVGEIVPRSSSTEFIVAFLLCSVCLIVNALLIGYMTSYMEELSRKSKELNVKINQTNTAMINLQLSHTLKKDIMKYIH